jgi:hypothetical protein
MSHEARHGETENKFHFAGAETNSHTVVKVSTRQHLDLDTDMSLAFGIAPHINNVRQTNSCIPVMLPAALSLFFFDFLRALPLHHHVQDACSSSG